MKQTAFLSFAILLFLTGCKKDLDLLSGQFFGVKEFLKSGNCDAKCGETADAEGETAPLKGVFDESNIDEEQNRFFVLDAKDDDFSIEVAVDPAISEEAFDLIRFRLTNDVRLRGVIEGYDQPANFNCKRGFILHLESLEDFFLE